MTSEQINAMAPGPETDRLVAEACGLGIMPGRKGAWIHNTSDNRCYQWRFSDDCGDAMFAAEKACRSSDRYPRGLILNIAWSPCWDSAWVSFECAKHDSGKIAETQAPTAPLAICRAILLLHSQQQKVSSTVSDRP